MTKWYCSVWLLLLSNFLFANTDVDEAFSHQQGIAFEYTFTPIDEVSALHKANWQPHEAGILNLGLVEQPMWLKVTLRNTGQKEFDLLLSVDNNLLDKITVFIQQQNNALQTLALGDKIPLFKRPIRHEAQLIPLHLSQLADKQIFIRLDHDGPLSFSLSLWNQIEYLKYKSRFNLVYGVLAGFMLAMAFTNFVLYYFTRQTYFLIGAALVAACWMMVIHIYGFSYRYLYSEWQWLQQYGQAHLVLLSTLLFTPLIWFTVGKQHLPHVAKRTLELMGLVASLCLLFLTALPIGMAVMASYTMSLILTVGYLVQTFIGIRCGYAYRFSLTSSCLLLFIALLYQFFQALGVTTHEWLDHPIVYFCSLFISMFVSYMLTKQHTVQRDNTIMLQQQKLAASQAEDALLKEKLTIQEQASEELETRIEERTFELQVTLRELEDKNRELEKLNMEDALTKVKNRRYFDKRLIMEVRRSRREQTNLSVIMLDIDHFKSINDRYGHLIGDQAICAIADLLRNALQRPFDEVFRYGGEEFVLLLPNTSLEGAIEIAEQIRKEVDDFKLTIGELVVDFTISAGIYSAISQDIHNPTQFTDLADKALYIAKQNGRNQVVSYQTEQETP
ncbi:hypothetical protein PALB_20740 [Pseudoalteromonas luteoviolacea B = ATCC 29581]|nr:hypothetical protein PALB_20740 [Pseudoalteromonas luteoviolacea B = ATCC 29581]